MKHTGHTWQVTAYGYAGGMKHEASVRLYVTGINIADTVEEVREMVENAPRLAARVERLDGLLREAGKELHRVGGCEGFEDGSTGETYPHSDLCDRMSRGWSEK